MASVRLQPPEPFNLKTPDEWPRWKKRFDQFRLASGLSDESEERQVSTLLYLLGSEAEDVLSSTGILADERNVYTRQSRIEIRRILQGQAKHYFREGQVQPQKPDGGRDRRGVHCSPLYYGRLVRGPSRER